MKTLCFKKTMAAVILGSMLAIGGAVATPMPAAALNNGQQQRQNNGNTGGSGRYGNYGNNGNHNYNNEEYQEAEQAAQAVSDVDFISEGVKGLGADTQTATKMLQGFIPVMNIVLGLIVILISIGMTIFSAFDIAYLAFPVFRNKCEEAKQTGQGLMASGKTNAKTGETKLRFVSDEAQYAITASETTQSGKNPFVIYFKKRILAYLLLAITVFILLTGNVTVLTKIAVDLVGGILDLIAGIGT